MKKMHPIKTASIYVLYYLSVIIEFVVNPIFWFQILFQNIGQVVITVRCKFAGKEKNDAPEIVMSLPFVGTWQALAGDVTPKKSHSWYAVTQRYAYDLVAVDDEGQVHSGRGTKLDQYYTWGREVLAPADGEVVQVVDGNRDKQCPRSGWIGLWTRDFRGNFVIIRHTENRFSFLAHFQKGSITVRKGDTVRQGDRLGLAGNSGHTTEPHVHFHVQDRANFYLANGVPIRFRNFSRKTEDEKQPNAISEGYITNESLIAPLPEGAEGQIEDKVEIPGISITDLLYSVIMAACFVYAIQSLIDSYLDLVNYLVKLATG